MQHVHALFGDSSSIPTAIFVCTYSRGYSRAVHATAAIQCATICCTSPSRTLPVCAGTANHTSSRTTRTVHPDTSAMNTFFRTFEMFPRHNAVQPCSLWTRRMQPNVDVYCGVSFDPNLGCASCVCISGIKLDYARTLIHCRKSCMQCVQ
jgi:hypothetical protein